MSYFNIVAQSSESTVVTEYKPQEKRSDAYQSEAELEKEFIRLLVELGYERLTIHKEKDLITNLRLQLEMLNNYTFSDSEWERFFTEVLANAKDGIVEKTRLIQEDHVQVLKRDDGTSKNILLIDKKSIHNNRLQVINQYAVSEQEGANHDNRYDVMWTYYGYPNSNYEGVNVEVMRCKNGEIMARDEALQNGIPDVDYVAGVPDSGVPHAIGYSNMSQKPFARPFIKYTPTWARSFTPSNQEMRNLIAEMKQIPVPERINGKKLLLVDDSIVRGTQLRETVDFLYQSGAKEVHMRSACPPIMFSCKYLNFSRSNSEMELIARRIIQQKEGEEGKEHIAEYADAKTERGKCLLQTICEEMGFDSLGYQSLDGILEAIGLERDKICTYCWTGEE